ncbi:MAG: SDR family NAD(P)-dependent oxidoreductase, partial [Syntrophobacteraceae bacterium]
MEAGTKLNEAEKICFFGLGAQFRDCYGQLVLAVGRSADFLSDNAPEKWGMEFFGKKCVPPFELARLADRTAVVITVRRYEDIFSQLQAMGAGNIFLACFDRGYDVVRAIKDLGRPLSPGDQAFRPGVVKGRWTLITGASRGIGRQIATAMARLGSNIIIHGREIFHLQETINACSASGVCVQTIAAELENPAELEDMLDNLAHNFPPIDIVFNNAGISLACSDPWDISHSAYLRHYAVNTVAPIRICY